MLEKGVYDLLDVKLRQPWRGDRFDRVENGVAVGMPDISATMESVDVWMEVKSATIPARESTPLLKGKNHELLLSQANWILRHKRAGGTCWLIIRANDVLMSVRISDWPEPEAVNKLSYNDILDHPTTKCAIDVRNGGAHDAWKRMRTCLIKNSR